jgi:hypothetical protein
VSASYAAFRRRFQVGTRFTCTHHTRPHVSGPRVVVKAQTNGIYWRGADTASVAQDCWLTWPKASKVRVRGAGATDGGAMTVLGEGGRDEFTYTLEG